jgi:alcohol dehydrogenase YqhD (iron-dependent ADH family)
MKDFTLHMPTRYHFGKTAFNKIKDEIKSVSSKVLVIYGKGSVKKYGILDNVLKELDGCEIKEFSGIEPNPRIETLRECIDLAREFKPDILLAVGGGSVLDGTKLISAAVN